MVAFAVAGCGGSSRVARSSTPGFQTLPRQVLKRLGGRSLLCTTHAGKPTTCVPIDLHGGVKLTFECNHPNTEACRRERAKLRAKP